jgi:hypothetical protein
MGRCVKLTIDRRRATRLVSTKVLGRTGGRVEAWGALGTQVRWHALRLLGLLRRGRQTGAALGGTASHYSTEEVARSMTDLRRLGLGRAVRVLAGATTRFNFALELRNAVLVSRWRWVSCCCFSWHALAQNIEVELKGRRVWEHMRGRRTLLSSGCAAARESRLCRGSSQSLGYGG